MHQYPQTKGALFLSTLKPIKGRLTDMAGFIQSVNFLFTGNYYADDGDNSIVAIGFGGTVRTYGGNDTVDTASFYTKVVDTWGNLTLRGLTGGVEVQKSGNGNVYMAVMAINAYVDHWGDLGDVVFYGGALCSTIYRSGYWGSVTFYGVTGLNRIYLNTDHGDIHLGAVGFSNVISRYGRTGNVTALGAGGVNVINMHVDLGDLNVCLFGGANVITRSGRGRSDITVGGMFNQITTGDSDDKVIALGGVNVVRRFEFCANGFRQ